MTQVLPLKSFHGNAAVRDAALQCLVRHRDAKELTSGLLFLGGGKFSPAAALVDAADPAAWQERTGLSAWIAYALDSLATVNTAVETASALLEAVGPGADTTYQGSAVIAAALSTLDCRHETLAEVCSVLEALHSRAASGDMPSNAEWRSIRRRATELTDRIDNEVDKPVAACIEAAAWSPVVAPASVAEVLRGWMQRVSVDAQLGWDEARHARAKERLDELYRRYIENNPEEKRDVFLLLEEHDPRWANDIKAFIAGQRRIAGEQADQALNLVLQVLSVAK